MIAIVFWLKKDNDDVNYFRTSTVNSLNNKIEKKKFRC